MQLRPHDLGLSKKTLQQPHFKSLPEQFPTLVSDSNLLVSLTSGLPLDLLVVLGISQTTLPHTFNKTKNKYKKLRQLESKGKIKPKHYLTAISCWFGGGKAHRTQEWFGVST